jgi:hypothetical protein
MRGTVCHPEALLPFLENVDLGLVDQTPDDDGDGGEGDGERQGAEVDGEGQDEGAGEDGKDLLQLIHAIFEVHLRHCDGVSLRWCVVAGMRGICPVLAAGYASAAAAAAAAAARQRRRQHTSAASATAPSRRLPGHHHKEVVGCGASTETERGRHVTQ